MYVIQLPVSTGSYENLFGSAFDIKGELNRRKRDEKDGSNNEV